MKRLLTTTAAAMFVLTGAAGTAMAQPYGPDDRRGGYNQGHGEGQDQHDNRGGYNQRRDRHDDRGGGHHWQRGQQISHDEWGQYGRVDWRRRHLRRPPRGYEWRQSNDGDYVLAAVATGLIASIIANSR